LREIANARDAGMIAEPLKDFSSAKTTTAF